VRVSQAIIRQSRKTWLAADGSKFARTAPVRIASLSEVEAFFTDAPPPRAVAERCRDWGTEIRVIRPG
jgi:DeoR family transcriptional regulator, glycerol-3-phosphate regulon repressor